VAVSWFAFVRHSRVPLFGLTDLGIHELGHLIFYIVPAGAFVTAIAGSALQILVPVGAATYFLRRRDPLAVAACLAWIAANIADVAVYVADAPAEQLELLGGDHDWAYLLGPEQLDRLDCASGIANGLRFVGLVTLVAAIAVLVDLARSIIVRHRRRSTDRAIVASVYSSRFARGTPAHARDDARVRR
jgi:hypothetical protein